MSDDKVTLSFDNATVKIKEQNRGRMKIVIKLDKPESEGYINFKNSVLPSGASEDEFIKTVFFMGLEQFHKNAMTMLNKYVEENADKLKEEGVDVDQIQSISKEISEYSVEGSTETPTTEAE